MKAILIARVSTEEQKEAGNSLHAQINRLEQYCRNRGFTVLRTCRALMKALIQAAEANLMPVFALELRLATAGVK